MDSFWYVDLVPKVCLHLSVILCIWLAFYSAELFVLRKREDLEPHPVGLFSASHIWSRSSYVISPRAMSWSKEGYITRGYNRNTREVYVCKLHSESI
jgi:hypothetical protein